MINFLHLKITQDYLIIQVVVGKYVTEATNGYLQTFQKLLWICGQGLLFPRIHYQRICTFLTSTHSRIFITCTHTFVENALMYTLLTRTLVTRAL